MLPGLCYGSSDVEADEAQAMQVHAALRAQGLPGSMPVYASPLRRCAELARRLGPAPVFDARLSEMDFGSWEMRSWDAIPRAEVDAWAADLLRYRPGGGESVLQVAERVAAFRRDLRARGHAQALVLCHAGTIRLLSALQGGQSLEMAALQAASTPHQVGYGEVILLKD
ncbi:histidine phosphatase family protein [Massilia sp. Se16.2.3]|uniref:histidine phosphatase family protein n=1 Tax=unclassified Massilia TaxID=2609279 RepID=UPI0035A59236